MHLRCSLPCHTLKIWLYNKVRVVSGGAVALCKLIQGSLGRWVRLAALCCPQELWSERGTLGGTAMTELDDMWNWEEANYVHQQLESKSCGQREQTFLTVSLVLNIASVCNRGEPELTFDPAHCVDNDGRLSALGATTPQGLQRFQVTVQVWLTWRLTVEDGVLWCALVCERRTWKTTQHKPSDTSSLKQYRGDMLTRCSGYTLKSYDATFQQINVNL